MRITNQSNQNVFNIYCNIITYKLDGSFFLWYFGIISAAAADTTTDASCQRRHKSYLKAFYCRFSALVVLRLTTRWRFCMLKNKPYLHQSDPSLHQACKLVRRPYGKVLYPCSHMMELVVTIIGVRFILNYSSSSYDISGVSANKCVA